MSMRPTSAEYIRLPVSDGLELEHLDQRAIASRRTSQASDARAVKFLIFASLFALVLSAANLSFLSLVTTVRRLRGPGPLRTPSVYLGLEKVVHDPPRCRSRGTFPQTLSTVRAGHPESIARVHAPDDKTTLIFGGPVHAIADFYVPDYGLENCTLNARHAPDPYSPAPRAIDVFLLPSGAGARGPRTFLDTVVLTPEEESTSVPFHCPGRSHVSLEWRCAGEGCIVEMPLEGVTALTASAESLSKTGFRITQYEGLHCIPST